MLNQFKYSAMQNMTHRAFALGGTVLLNLVFGLCGLFGAYGMGGLITAVSLSGCALFALLVVCIVCDFEAIKRLFGAPSGYLAFLTPVPRWKILLGQVLPMLVLDLVSLIIGIVGVVIQSFLLAGITWNTARHNSTGLDLLGWLLLIVLLHYMMLLLLLFFTAALNKTILYRVRGKTLISIVAAVAVVWLFNLSNFALAPFTTHFSVQRFTTFNLSLGFNLATFVYFALVLGKNAVLFFGTSYLMERKINL